MVELITGAIMAVLIVGWLTFLKHHRAKVQRMFNLPDEWWKKQ